MIDVGTSIIAKLKSKAVTSGKSFQVLLQLFCQEEFLRRVSLSKYSENFVLKGGLFIYTLSNFESRVTIDVDFMLRMLSGDMAEIERIVGEIIKMPTGSDFIHFEPKSFEQIAVHRKYKGVSFQLIGKIKNTKSPFNVDIGIGDVIVPNSVKRKIPAILPGFSQPEINTYSLQSTIAEKLDAILQRLELTSRMKDFYDIWYLLITFDFDGATLKQAIQMTLQNRGATLNKDSIALVSSLGDDKDMQAKWRQFIKKTALEDIAFDDVLQAIVRFFAPIFASIVGEVVFGEHWDSKEGEWGSVVRKYE